MSSDAPAAQWWSNGFDEYDSEKATKPQIMVLQHSMHILLKLITKDEEVALTLAGPGIFLPGMSKRRASELISRLKALKSGEDKVVKNLASSVTTEQIMRGNACPDCGEEVKMVGSLKSCSKCGASYLSLAFKYPDEHNLKHYGDVDANAV